MVTGTGTSTGLAMTGSSVPVTASSITVTGGGTGLSFGASNTGSFTVSGATSLTGITGTGIAANGATGSYTFTGDTTITFSGAGRGLDLRNSQFTLFQTGNITITGDGTTAGSIAVDLSGSKSANGAQLSVVTPNITLADAAWQDGDRSAR